MKKVKFSNGIQGKGFAAALVLSICAVGISTYAAYNGAVSGIKTKDEKKEGTDDRIFIYTEATEPVNAEKYDVPREIADKSDEGQTADMEITDAPSLSSDSEEEPAGLFFKNPKTMPIADAAVINPYSNGELVKSETLGVWKTHDGIDIAAPAGTAVSAMMKGTVTEVKKDALWGVCVIIDHGDGIISHYCGLSENVPVKAGQEVAMGEIIGQTGDTADIECKLEPHLHFGVIENGAWVDPVKFIKD